MSFNEWKEYSFYELIDIIGGGTPKTTVEEYWNGHIPWLSVKDFNTDNRTVYETEKSITELGLQKSSTKLLNKGDLIISARGTVGALAQLGKQMAFNQSCYGLRANSKTTNDFLYYLLKYKLRSIQSNTHGSVFSTITKDTFKILKAIIPIDIEEQKAISKILSDLDEKIEVNNKINKKLEEMAQVIFKQWFIDFEFPNEDGKPYKSSGGEMSESEQGMIPKGWEYKKLDDVLNTIEAGNRPKGGAGNLTEGIPSIGAENIIGLGKYDYSKEKFVTEDYFNSMKKGIVQSKDVLLYKDGAQLGRKTMIMDGFPHEKCCINSHVFILRSNNSISQSYLYFWLDQDYMTQNIINLNANSAQPGINQIQVKSLNILVPTKEIIEKFELTVNSLLDKLLVNCKENTKLANIRDTLLPKLMSGEIRVPLD